MIRQILAAAIQLVRSPAAAYGTLLARKPYSIVRWIVLLGLTPVYGVLLMDSLRAYPGPLARSSYLYVLVPLFTPLLVLITWVLQSALLTGVARVFGSRVPFRINLLVYGYAQAPYLLTLPGIFLPLGVLRYLLIFANGWSLLLLYVGLALSHGLGRGRTLAILVCTQFLVPVLAAAGLALLLGSALAG